MRDLLLKMATAFAFAANAGAQIFDWSGAAALGQAGNIVVADIAEARSGVPGEVVVAGTYLGVFANESSGSDRDAFVQGLRGDTVTDWEAPFFIRGFEGDIVLAGVSRLPGGGLVVAGSFGGALEADKGREISFFRSDPNGIPNGRDGFVFRLEPSGDLIDGFQLPRYPVAAVEVGPGGDLFLTGGDNQTTASIARRYRQDGGLVWAADVSPGRVVPERLDVGQGARGQVAVTGILSGGGEPAPASPAAVLLEARVPLLRVSRGEMRLTASEPVDLAIGVRRFSGGTVDVSRVGPGELVPLVSSGFSADVSGQGLVASPSTAQQVPVGEEAVWEFEARGVTELRFGFLYSQGAVPPGGSMADYEVLLSTIGTGNGTFPVTFPSVDGDSFPLDVSVPLDDVGGSGVDLVFEFGGDQGTGQVGTFATPQVVLPSPAGAEVFLAQLDSSTGALASFITATSNGGADTNFAVDVDVAPDGSVRFAFDAFGENPRLQGDALPPFPDGARASRVAKIGRGGQVEWVVPVAEPEGSGASVLAGAVGTDPKGNTWVGASVTGVARYQCGILRTRNPDGRDAAVLQIDDAGRRLYSQFSSGTEAFVRAVPRALRVGQFPGVVYLAGTYLGGPATFGSTSLVGEAGSARGFVARVERRADQQRYIVFQPPGARDGQRSVKLGVAEQEGFVYLPLVLQDGREAVAAFLTGGQRERLLGDPDIGSIEPDFPLQTASCDPDAGWALGRLNAVTALPPTGPYPFCSGGACVPANFYLIDTAVDNTAPVVSGMTEQTVFPTEIVRGFGEPLVSTRFLHGTQMLGLVCGGGFGVVPDLPLRVFPYDIFPDSPSDPTYLSFLISAVNRVALAHESRVAASAPSPEPAVMLLSLSSTAPATSAALQAEIDFAVAKGITVVLAGGNEGAAAASYVPASAGGATAGAVTVGATTVADTVWTGSNTGAGIELLAPGAGVKAPTLGAGSVLVSGTSSAAALAAGCALEAVSANPFAKPAAVEAFLGASASVLASPLVGTTSGVAHVASGGTPAFFTFDDWVDTYTAAEVEPGDDFDSDGLQSGEEYFKGLSLADSDVAEDVGEFSLAGGTATFDFLAAKHLFDPGSPGTLRDGGTFLLQWSEDLKTWVSPAGLGFAQVTDVSPTQMIVRATFPVPPGVETGFVRIKVTPGA